jgi:hypothetical protein
MMRKKLGLLSLTFFSSLMALFFLYILSNQLNHRQNGFIRLIPPHLVSPVAQLDLTFNSYYIAGCDKNRVFLGNQTSPRHLLSSTFDGRDTASLDFVFPPMGILLLRAPITFINYPNIYVIDGSLPLFLQGTLPENKLSPEALTHRRFTLSIPLSSASLIVRCYDTVQKQNVLAKEALVPGASVRQVGILQKQVDGIFCTDGMFSYNDSLNKIIYIYYYRNEFICMDSELRISYHAKTIDTNSVAKIKVADIASEKMTMLSSPSLLINKKCCISGNRLFVCSGLCSTNESTVSFDRSSVVDVYSVGEGKYRYSFYIPDFAGKKIKDFRVHDSTIIALYDHYLVTYRLNKY